MKASPWLGRRLGALLAPLATLALASPASADVNAAVGGVRDPAAGALTLRVQATETEGAGLRTADAVLAGRPVDSENFGDPSCAPDTCPATGAVTLTVDTTAVANGVHRLVVRVVDGNGTLTRVLDRAIRVANGPRLPPPSAQLPFGGTPGPQPPSGAGGGDGGVAGEQAACRAPRLTVALAQRPLRVHRRRAVLAAGRRYRFRGRLTCRIDGRRRSAPRGTRIQLRRFVRGRLVVRSSARVRARGVFTLRLRFRRSMVVAFRFRGAGGRLVQVRMPVIVSRGSAGSR